MKKLRMIKVCHITSVHPRYDTRIFFKECITLSKKGYAVNLIVADNLPDEIKDNINIYNVGQENGRFKRIFITPNRIYKKVISLKPDIIHFHDPELIIIALKLIKHGFKVIYDVHEDVPKQLINKYWIPKLLRPILARLVAQIEHYASKKLAGIISATPLINNRFTDYKANAITICNYPIITEFNSQINWQHRTNSICYIGSISKTRGIEYLIDSLNYSQIKLVLAGPFSGNIQSNIINNPLISYQGIIDRVEVNQLLNKAMVGIVTLLPTPSYIESLPIKMFEYMLAGIPIIASDFSLWRNLIEEFNCAIFVDPTNPQQIANACIYLLANQNIAQSMGERGRVAVINYFNWENEAKKLVNFYSLIMAYNQ